MPNNPTDTNQAGGRAMIKMRIKCPSCLAIGVILNFSGQKVVECGNCKYVVTKEELTGEVVGTTCPPNCNGECSEVLNESYRED